MRFCIVRQYERRVLGQRLQCLKLLHRPVGERHNVPFAGLGVLVWYRPCLGLEVDVLPASKRELTSTLPSEHVRCTAV